VTCSGHGRCLTDRGAAVCVCDPPYRAEGLECVCDPDCGSRECGIDPVCGTLSCGFCGVDERCTDSTGVCEVPACSGGLLDVWSGLCWQNEELRPDLVPQYLAVDHCSGLDLGGFGRGSWRLPTVSELRSLIRGCPATQTGGACGVTDDCTAPECSDIVSCEHRSEIPGWECPEGRGPGSDGAYWLVGIGGHDPPPVYWSSSRCGEPSGNVWYVSFFDGTVAWATIPTHYLVRCVRDGP
jgi:hypothetical protein